MFPLLLLVHTVIHFKRVDSCNSDCPNEEGPPPLPVSHPVVLPILIAKLVCNISSVHVVIVVIDEVEAKMSHFTDLLVHRRPNLPLLQNLVHALLDGGEHVNWLGVIHRTRKKIWTVDGVQQSGDSRTPP